MNNGFTTTVKSFFLFSNCHKYISLRGFSQRSNCMPLFVRWKWTTHSTLCYKNNTRSFSSRKLAQSHTGTCTLQGRGLKHTCTRTHTHTHTEDIKAQGIANVEDALKHLSRHINDPFHPCISSLLLTVKTASRKTKRCFLFLINMREKKKENSHPRTSTVNKTYKSTVPTEVRHLVC